MGGKAGRNRNQDVEWLKANCFRLGGASFDTSGFVEELRAFSKVGNPKGRFDCWHNVSDEAYQV
jgi:hypothetical protein